VIDDVFHALLLLLLLFWFDSKSILKTVISNKNSGQHFEAYYH
jgi:hypothetical protein